MDPETCTKSAAQPNIVVLQTPHPPVGYPVGLHLVSHVALAAESLLDTSGQQQHLSQPPPLMRMPSLSLLQYTVPHYPNATAAIQSPMVPSVRPIVIADPQLLFNASFPTSLLSPRFSSDLTAAKLPQPVTLQPVRKDPIGSRKREKESIQKPKRPLSAYNLFFKAEREKMIDRAVGQDHNKQGKPGIDFEQMAKIIAKRWSSIDKETRKPYEEMACQDKERYRALMEAFKKQQGTELTKAQKELESSVSEEAMRKYLAEQESIKRKSRKRKRSPVKD